MNTVELSRTWMGEPVSAMEEGTGTALRHSYFQMGATLYVPATHPGLRTILSGRKHLSRSLVLCTEDAVSEADLPHALRQLRQCLPGMNKQGRQIFLRPRSPQVLAEVLDMPGAEHLDGVVIPKVSVELLESYLRLISDMSGYWIMPTIETEVAIDGNALRDLRMALTTIKDRVLTIRLGGNDLLRMLGLRRVKGFTAYDTPLRSIIDTVIWTFRPYGFEISAPVFERLDDVETLRRELALDVMHGLFNKTAIHPSQVHIIEEAMRPSGEDMETARNILSEESPAVFLMHGAMCEPATHRAWAERILARARVYGTPEWAAS